MDDNELSIKQVNCFIEEMKGSFGDDSLFEQINRWERESIAQIQSTAETTRIDLREIVKKSKERLSLIHHNLRSSQTRNPSSSTGLQPSIERLKQLQKELTTFLSTQDTFSHVIGNTILSDDRLLAKHSNEDWNHEYLLGNTHYSHGRHTIRFRIEQSGTPYNIFFGCISSEDSHHRRISLQSSSTVGWFGHNQVYRHGSPIKTISSYGYDSSEIAMHDRLQLIFDCDNKQMEFFQEDTNKRHILSIDTDQTPLPWQFLMILTDKDDCVRILQEAFANAPLD